VGAGQHAWVGKRDTFVPLREATLEEGTLSVPYSRAQLQGAPMIDPDGALEDWEEAKLYSHYGIPYPQQAGLRMTRYYELFPNRRLWRPPPLRDRFPTQQGGRHEPSGGARLGRPCSSWPSRLPSTG
jgi:hypothetical protein